MATEKQIQQQLDLMDSGMFLDKEWDSRYGNIVYSIKHVVEGTLYTALEWRDPSGRPLGLSESLSTGTILDTLRSQEGSIQEALKTAMVNNAARKELTRQKAQEEAIEIAKEWDSSKRAKKSISFGTGSIDHKTSLNKRDI